MRRTHRYDTEQVYELAALGDDQAMAVCRAVARCSGPGRYSTRQWKPEPEPTIGRRYERRSSSARASRFHRPDDLVREKLRLRVAVLQRVH